MSFAVHQSGAPSFRQPQKGSRQHLWAVWVVVFGFLLLLVSCSGKGDANTEATTAESSEDGSSVAAAATATVLAAPTAHVQPTAEVGSSQDRTTYPPATQVDVAGSIIEVPAPSPADKTVVFGVSYNERLKLHTLPGFDQPVSAELVAWTEDISGSSQAFETPDGQTWLHLQSGGEQGWALPKIAWVTNPRLVARDFSSLGAMSDLEALGVAVALEFRNQSQDAGAVGGDSSEQAEDFDATVASDAGGIEVLDKDSLVIVQVNKSDSTSFVMIDLPPIEGAPKQELGERLSIAVDKVDSGYVVTSVISRTLCASDTNGASCNE